jgi:signal transduction histidine kinase
MEQFFGIFALSAFYCWLFCITCFFTLCGLLILFFAKRTFAITSPKGALWFYHSTYPILSEKKEFRILLQKIICPSHPALIHIKDTYFFVYRKKLILTYWSIHKATFSLAFFNFRETLNSYPWPACVLSQKGKILFSNPAFCQSLGYAQQDMQGNYFADFLIEPITDNIYHKIHQFKGAQDTHIGMNISHMITQENIVILFLFSANFKESMEKIGDIGLLCALPLPAALLDEYGNIKQINQLMQDSMIIRAPATLAQWIDKKDRPNFSKQLKKLRKEPQSGYSAHLKFNNIQNKPFLAFLKYIPGHDTGATGQFLSVFTMENQFLPTADPHRLQLLGQLASGIVHDFNNLLTGILGFCDLLLQRHSPQEASFKDIDQIKQSAMRAAKLIQQLLAFSKSSPPCRAPISIKQCVQNLFPLISRIVGPKILISLKETLSSKFITYGDSGQLEQIFLNLSINARDAMPEGGSLTFTLKTIHLKQKMSVIKGSLPPQRYVIIEMQDTGSGIEKQNILRIFDPFFSTKDPGQGTGLGLSNVLQIMESFQGGIAVSTEIGQGTTFSLYFPEYKGEAKSNSPVVRAPIASSSLSPFMAIRILLVEDEDPVRLFAARALREKGHEVIEARDGSQAMRFLQNHLDVHIVVTDVMMPGIDGPSLAIAMKKLSPSIKILFVSGYPEEEVRAHLPADMKEIYFLPKPFALAELVDKIQQFFPT